MPEYLSPGVYVEEIDAGPRPIEGVSTSTAGAVGVTAFGPTRGKPELVTSLADFVRKFGGYLEEPDAATRASWDLRDGEGGYWWQFPLAVKGFFDNGGQRLYVKRVFSAGAVASSATLGEGLVSEIVEDAPVGATEIKVRHLFGVGDPAFPTFTIMDGGTGQVLQDSTGTPLPPFSATAYDAITGKITLSAALTAAVSVRRHDFIELSARAANPTLAFTAKSQGSWGNAIQVRVRPSLARTLNVLADPAIPQNDPFNTTVSAIAAGGDTSLSFADVRGLNNGDTVLIKSRRYALSAKAAGAGNAGTFTISPAAAEALTVGERVTRVRKANTSAARPTLRLSGAARLYPDAVVELDRGTAKQALRVVSIDGDEVTFNGNVQGELLEGQVARVIEAEVEVRYRPAGGAEVTEAFGPVRLRDDGTPNYLVTQVNDRSNLVDAATVSGPLSLDLADFPTPGSSTGGWVDLTGGDDDLDGLRVQDFIGDDGGSGQRTGIKALEEIDNVSICMVPGMWAPSVQSELIIHCESLKDRFAILDPPPGRSVAEIRAFRGRIDTEYAALYYPWLRLRDPAANREVIAAPSGHLAGIYARVDVERGVHKAPANEVVRGISAFEQDITKREQDVLNPDNINVLRFFEGRGHRVWGARVATDNDSFRYINVRRLFIFVEESLDEGLQWVVFEPNDETLWSRVRQTIANFLTTVWRNGALFGTKQQEAFFVRCDRSTMTQADIDNGRLICLVGIAPVKPAEFVIIRIQQKLIEATTA